MLLSAYEPCGLSTGAFLVRTLQGRMQALSLPL